MNTKSKQESQDAPVLSDSDTAEVLVDINSLIFEAALGRLLLELEENSLTELEQFLSEDHEPEKLIEHLLAKYPIFQQHLDEETEALEEKAKALNS